MPDPVSYEEKNRWFQELLALQEKISAKRCADMVGKQYRVLVEGLNEKNNELQTRTSGNIIVEVSGSENLIGTFQTVEITSARNRILKGKII